MDAGLLIMSSLRRVVRFAPGSKQAAYTSASARVAAAQGHIAQHLDLHVALVNPLLLPCRTHRHPVSDEGFTDGAEGAAELAGDGAEGIAVGVELDGLGDLVIGEGLAAHGDAVVGQELEQAALG